MIIQQLVKQVIDFHSGENFTGVNLTNTLADITWQEAAANIQSLNSIAALAFHLHYYIDAVSGVLQGQPLNAHDKFSYNHPPVTNEAEWDQLRKNVLTTVAKFAELIGQLAEAALPEPFIDGKYGTYYRNLAGPIEHAHYHLGQIAIIKKMLRAGQ